MGDLDHEEFRRSSAPDCLDPKELETGLWESVAGRGTSAVLGWGLENVTLWLHPPKSTAPGHARSQ